MRFRGRKESSQGFALWVRGGGCGRAGERWCRHGAARLDVGSTAEETHNGFAHWFSGPGDWVEVAPLSAQVCVWGCCCRRRVDLLCHFGVDGQLTCGCPGECWLYSGDLNKLARTWDLLASREHFRCLRSIPSSRERRKRIHRQALMSLIHRVTGRRGGTKLSSGEQSKNPSRQQHTRL